MLADTSFYKTAEYLILNVFCLAFNSDSRKCCLGFFRKEVEEVFVILLLFGAKKIPELMRGAGKGVRAFKDGMKETTTDESTDEEKKES